MAITLLTNATVIDGTGAEPQEASVVVEGTLIKDLVATGKKVNADREIDCGARTLMPGLIDCHVHIGAVDHAFGDQHKRYHPSYMAFLIAKRLQAMLECGFTTVRDAGGADLGFKRAVEEGIIPGPRLVQSGHAITQTGGHGDARTRSEPGDYHYVGPYGMLPVLADGVSECRKVVREELRRGADVIKVFASGGAISPSDKIDSSQFSFGELRSMVEECADQGTYVLAHALSAKSIARCVEAGCRSIEHGNFLDPSTAEKMAAAGTYLVPTIIAYEYSYEHADEYQLTDANREKVAAAVGSCREAVQHAVAAGVKIANGSDMLGKSLPVMGREIELQAEAQGANNAIRSATAISAELLGLSDVLGTITPGKEADLILVDGDPLKDPGLLGRPEAIVMVTKAGTVYKNTPPL